MNFNLFLANNSQSVWNTVLFICIILVGIVLIGFAIYVCIVRNDFYNREKTLVHIKDEKNKLHGELEKVCKPYLVRLNQTSATNLYHLSLYSDLSPEYKSIINTFEPAVDLAIKDFEEHINDDMKKFKPYKKDLNDIFTAYKSKVERMSQVLVEHFKTEDGIRRELKRLTREYDDCREEFVRNEETLEILSDTFFRIFDLIEEKIELVKRGLESTDYDSASESLGIIKQCNVELSNGLRTLPALCIDVNETIPEMIDEIEEEYEKMKANNIPVHHLHVMASLNEYRTQLKVLIESMSDFEYQRVRNHIDDMIVDLTELKNSFKKEYDSAEIVEEDCMKVYNECGNIEKNFISLRQKLVEIIKYYQIAPTYDGYVDKIQVRINDLDGVKRQLDTYVHSSTKQPYSILFNKMKELQGECDEVNGMIHELNSYIDSLKIDCDNAYELVNSVYLEVKHSEYLLRELNVFAVSNPFRDTIERIYIILDRLNNILMTTPIDVVSVNRYVKELVTLKAGFVESVKDSVEQASKAEQAIVIANRVRPSLNNYRSLLSSCEEDFFKGEFRKANENAELVINKAKKA